MSTKWTFLSHHSHVLLALADDPKRTIDQLGVIVGITTRSVSNILSDLVNENYIEVEKSGRRNFYRINKDAPLRHPTSSSHTVGELIDAMGAIH